MYIKSEFRYKPIVMMVLLLLLVLVVVMMKMLRYRIGGQRFDAALKTASVQRRGKTSTTEWLLEVCQAAAELPGDGLYRTAAEVEDFFNYWVYTGFRPALKVRWAREDGALVGTVHSDVPFGTFDLPMRVVDPSNPKQINEFWVRVVDGEATFRRSAPAGATLKVDPDRRTITRSRSVVRVEELR